MPLFDYDLVSPLAVYRNPVPRDLPGLLALAGERAAGLKRDPAACRDALAATAAEFSRHKARGTILLIEVGQDPAGYCVISTAWSHASGGTVLCIDELYVRPGHDRLALARDLLALLAEVAPAGSAAIRLAPGVADRRLQAACARLGFHREADPGMIREARRRTP